MESYPRMEKLTHSLSRQFPSPTPYVTQNKIISIEQGISVQALSPVCCNSSIDPQETTRQALPRPKRQTAT